MKQLLCCWPVAPWSVARRLAPAMRAAVVLGIALLGFAGEVLAYLDPGTGSILLQGLIAAIAAAITYCSLYWHRVKEFFRVLLRRSPRRPPSNDDPSN